MYRLFPNQPFELSKTNSPLMPRIRNLIFDHYKYQLEFYNEYGAYYNDPSVIPSNHVLLKLLYLLADYVSYGKDVYRAVNEHVHQICSVLRITSEFTPGVIHTDALYTDTCIIMAQSYETELFNKTDWKTMRPLRCLTHPFTSMELHVPKVTKSQLGKGISAVGIDLGLLGYMLQQWLIENNIAVETIADERESINLFLSRFVVPGLLPEQIDISLRNRMMFIYTDSKVPLEQPERSFVKTYEEALVHPMKMIFNVIDTSRARYLQALKEIPLVFTETYFEAIPKDLYGLNTYTYWAMALILLDWIEPWIEIVKGDQTSNTDIMKILIRADRFIYGTGCMRYCRSDIRGDFFNRYKRLKEVLMSMKE